MREFARFFQKHHFDDMVLFADSCASRVASGELAETILREREALPEDAVITTLVNTTENYERQVK